MRREKDKVKKTLN